MADNVRPKTDKEVTHLSLPDDKDKQRISIGDGLVLELRRGKKGCGKYWLYPYRYDGKRKDASLGVYSPGQPKHLGIKDAKGAMYDVKKLLAQGIDPNIHKLEQKEANIRASREKKFTQEEKVNTYENLAREWHRTHSITWTEKYANEVLNRHSRHVFPHIGEVPVNSLTRKQIADVVAKMVRHGNIETARKVSQVIRKILEYSCDRGLIDAIPMGNMKSLIPAIEPTPMPALTDPEEVGDLLRAIDSYQGSFVVKKALQLLPYLCVRPGEFRSAKWVEFSLDDGVWTIPAPIRKQKKAKKLDPKNVHLVPLSKQAITILRGGFELTGQGRHVFPSIRGDSRPISENTINAALSSLGYKGKMVAHGWRSTFSTIMNEKGFNPDAIERQLAHVERDKVRAAYNRSDYLEERTRMMQAWADYLDELREM